MGYKTTTVEWNDGEKDISVDCLYECGDPSYEDAWIPDMATLTVVGEHPGFSLPDADRRAIWNHAYDLANG